MKRAESSRTLNHGVEALWSVLSDFENVADWNPTLQSAHLLGTQKRGVGASRQCTLNDGKNHVEERVIRWEEGRLLEIEIVDGTLPFRKASVLVELESESPKRTRVHMTTSFEPKGGALGSVAAEIVLKPMLRRLFGRLFDGLEAQLERSPDGEALRA